VGGSTSKCLWFLEAWREYTHLLLEPDLSCKQSQCFDAMSRTKSGSLGGREANARTSFRMVEASGWSSRLCIGHRSVDKPLGRSPRPASCRAPSVMEGIIDIACLAGCMSFWIPARQDWEEWLARCLLERSCAALGAGRRLFGNCRLGTGRPWRCLKRAGAA